MKRAINAQMDTHTTFMPIISATKAFKELGKDGMCLYKMEDDNHQSVFVRKNDAILTFYPDSTPKCDDKSTYCSCSKS
uniref:hypothetical protein n=1 Tax=Wolbachia endosymbiont (group A) of Volucella inflata TaxID=2954065 RepID=UPI0022273C63|nr:hypothetical protein [Wolbachia endosymbiont (group A) of Volucella inflata]